MGRPAALAASIASCGAFSGTSRPVHTAGPPPGPNGQAAGSTPFRTGTARTTCDHASAVRRLTAVKAEVPGAAAMADSSHGSGGVCSVVSTGTSSIGAIATGRWWRLWLCTTSKREVADRGRSSIKVR
ncbi:hypothetical protein L615_002500000240 [Nocardioides sp. J9]|nr:hypothetical protein [Nocardioides sp. J9]TWG99595.1 hypothetical protein L615_002500000240 [Nocardioides sp. J9]